MRNIPKAKIGDTRLGVTIKRRRLDRGLTLDELAAKSGVSRASISKIERGAVNPTTSIMGRLAEALDLSISQVIGGRQPKRVIHIKPEDQPVFQEKKSGFTRRSLSPLYRGRGIDFVLNSLPPKAKTGPFPAHRDGVEEHLYVLRGRLKVTLNGESQILEPGHFLFYQGDIEHTFENLSNTICRYFIVIDNTRLR